MTLPLCPLCSRPCGVVKVRMKRIVGKGEVEVCAGCWVEMTTGREPSWEKGEEKR